MKTGTRFLTAPMSTATSMPTEKPAAGNALPAGKCKNETVALLDYMLHHNEQHAAELDQMAANLEKLGSATRPDRSGMACRIFRKGNMRLSLALTLVKEQLKED